MITACKSKIIVTWHWQPLSAVCLSALILVTAAFAAPGDLDPTFGSGGIVTTSFTGGIRTNFASALAIQSDGKILTVGEGYIGTGNGWDFAIVRYNTDGSLDSSFGGTGVVITQVGASNDGARSLAIQPDGKIVAAGYSCGGAGAFCGGSYSFAVVRYNPDGSLDTTFNGSGKVITLEIEGYANSVAIQTDGKIVAAGNGRYLPNNAYTTIRYNADGSLDASFNGTGIVITPVGNSFDSATSVAIQTDGKIVVAGYSNNDIAGSSFAVVRYRTNGLLDLGFHGTGKVLTPFGNGFSGASALAIQRDGKIIAAGYSDHYPNSDFAIVRYSTYGFLDESFGNAGKAVISVGNISDFANAVAIQPDGKIVAAGKSFTGGDGEFSAVRLEPNGSLDATFNGTGKVITNTVGNDASSVAIQEDGKIVVAGGYDDDISIFVLVRYQGDQFSKLAFTSDRDGNREIYVMNSNGKQQVRLTDNAGTDCFPTFSPDGRKIAFVSENSSGSFAIKIMNADGTNQREITSIVFNNNPNPWMEAFSLSWSPGGRKIAFQENGDIFSVSVDGGDRQNLTNHPAMDSEPAWSTDGLRILFISSRDTFGSMFTMKTDGSDVRALPNDGEYEWDSSPDWSPHGNKIAFALRNEKLGPLILTADADGTNRQLFDNTIVSGYFGARNNPKWSPDGSKIAFDMAFGPNVEIFIKNVDGSGFRQLTDTVGWNFQPSWQPPLKTIIADFDGDRRSDVSVFRPTDAAWYLDQSTDGFSATQFGLFTDKITPADYDGDGKTDIGVYRNGTWYWLGSADAGFHAVAFGLANDVPTAADYDGDGKADISVFRPSDGTWYRQDSSSGQFNSIHFGQHGDVPMSGDYDGDGKTDLTVYRPSNGYWYIFRSSDDQVQANPFGSNKDIPLNGDFDGDGLSDLAVFRPSNGTWYIARPTGIPGQNFDAIQFGISTDIPAPADYDGDGMTDIAVFRNGTWYLLQSTSGFAAVQFGLATDKPIPAAYRQ